MKYKPHQTGMTLIEIMIALLIGAFLLGGVLQIFSGSQQTYRMQENLSRLQENGRFALDFLAHDIRMAGYWGCLSPNSPNIDIAGADNNVGVANIDDGTDSITLKGIFDPTLTPTGACDSPANCGPGGPLTCLAPPSCGLVNCYTDLSSTIVYKINNAVLQQDTNNQHNGMVEGIENMQILYGVDTDDPGDHVPNYYVPANPGWAATDWAKVVSIRISLLAVTLDDNLTSQPMAYTYNGVTTTPTDHRVRRVFNATIALRNRLP